VDGPILNGVDNTSEYKTIEFKYGQRSLDLCKLADAFWLNISLALTTEPHTPLVPTNEVLFQMSIKRFVELTNPTRQN
jgi:hypothetical protein